MKYSYNGDVDLVSIPYERIVVDDPDKEAVLYEFYNGDEAFNVWVPRNLIKAVDDGEIEIPEWLALNEGLI